MNLPKKPEFTWELRAGVRMGPSYEEYKYESVFVITQEQFDKWYDETFAGAVEVTAHRYSGSWVASESHPTLTETNAYTAFLINIKPSKEETLESLVNELLEAMEIPVTEQDCFERLRDSKNKLQAFVRAERERKR